MEAWPTNQKTSATPFCTMEWTQYKRCVVKLVGSARRHAFPGYFSLFHTRCALCLWFCHVIERLLALLPGLLSGGTRVVREL